ncbi:MAG: selenide, water dikinase SelD [Gemmatimonadota bacterium]
MGPEDLRRILSFLPTGTSADELIVGLDNPDDAAVYQVRDDLAVVASVDFFTPIVDDPAEFGAIAAANSFSDLYAMGASPAFALSLLGFPAETLPVEIAGAMLSGAAEVCREAGAALAGGHSIIDLEPKFGLAAIGFAHPDRLFRKSGAVPGDALVLGKALGIGVLATAIKRAEASAEEHTAAVRSMRQLNRAAAEALAEYDAHAVTDITGFGLLGHLHEVCVASGHGAAVFSSAPQLVPGTDRLLAAGCVPGGTARNRSALEDAVEWPAGSDDSLRNLLFDPQTSGGLLAAVPEAEAESLRREWIEAGYAASVVGRIEERQPEGDTKVIRVEA